MFRMKQFRLEEKSPNTDKVVSSRLRENVKFSNSKMNSQVRKISENAYSGSELNFSATELWCQHLKRRFRATFSDIMQRIQRARSERLPKKTVEPHRSNIGSVKTSQKQLMREF